MEVQPALFVFVNAVNASPLIDQLALLAEALAQRTGRHRTPPPAAEDPARTRDQAARSSRPTTVRATPAFVHFAMRDKESLIIG